MPRTRRLVINDETAVYHVMSRTALDGFPLGYIEKDFMLDLIRRYSSLVFSRNFRGLYYGITTSGITDGAISGENGLRIFLNCKNKRVLF